MLEEFPASEYTQILLLHGSGKLVSVKPGNKPKTPVTPQLLNGFMSEERFRIDHAMYMHSRDFLPMPVPASPILCLLMQSRSHFNRYTDSFATLSQLRIIVQCFALNPYLRNERIEKAHAKALEQTVVLEEQMHKEIANIGDNVDQFIKILERTTYYRIHIYEQCVHDMFEMNIPLACCLTPSNETVIAQDVDRMQSILFHFLKNKEAIRNVRMEKAMPEGETYEHIKYFSCDPNAQPLYNNFLDRQTVMEYLKFIQ